jgi:hypothetical protein
MTLSLRRLFTKRRRPAFSRSATRYTCQIDGTLMVIDRLVNFDGRVSDFSSGGAMFRPKLAYLMDRRDVPICLVVGDVEIFGRIASTTPSGFGIRFDDPLEEEDVLKLLAHDTKPKSETPAKALTDA